MILQCPSCDAKFLLPDQSIGATGRRVKCGRCFHQWHAKPAANPLPDIDALVKEMAPVPVEMKPMAAESGLPVVVSKKRLLPLIVANVLLLAAVLTLCMVLFLPQAIGLAGTEGLALQEVSFAPRLADEKGVVLTGKIVNASTVDKPMPQIRISLVDANKKLLKDPWYESEPTRVLKPKEVFSFKTRPLEVEPVKGSHLVVELGNPLELLVRRATLWPMK